MSTIVAKEQGITHTYYVVESAARMPTSCWGRYGKVAIVRTTADAPAPRSIRDIPSRRQRIVALRDRQFAGSSDRCALAVARRCLEQDARELALREIWATRTGE